MSTQVAAARTQGEQDARTDVVDLETLSDLPLPAASRFWVGAAAVSTAVLLTLNIIVSRTAIAPRTPWDEIGPLEMARWLAGDGPVAKMSGAGYFPGWGILLTPIWWFTDDPRTVYAAAIAVVIALAMLTIVPLARIGQILGLPLPQAVTAAALTLMIPARTVNADYTLSENLLTLLIACAALSAFRLWQRPDALRLLLFVLSVAAAYLTHTRALSIVIAAAVWLVLFALRDWRVTVGGAVLLAAGYVLVGRLVDWITVPLLLSGFGQGDLLADKIHNLSPGPFVRVAVTQGWGQFVGSLGLIALGAVVLGALTWKELRRWRVGPFGFLAGMLVLAFIVSVVAWSNSGPQERFDAQVYTRYLDPFAVVPMMLGVSLLLRGARRWLPVVAGSIAVLDVVVVMFKVAPWANSWGRMDGPANSAAILAWAKLLPDEAFPHPLIPAPGNANEFWFWASLCLVVGVALMIVLRNRPRVAAAAMAVAFTVLSLEANPSQVRGYPDHIEAAIERAEAASGAPEGSFSVDVDYECRGPALTQAQVLNWTGFWLAPREVKTIDPRRGETHEGDVVIACHDWPQGQELGARPMKDSTNYTYRVWVLPGQLQDELSQDGLLQPTDDSAS